MEGVPGTSDPVALKELVRLIIDGRDGRDVLDPVALKELVRTPLITDRRNILDPAQWRAAGWSYLGTGRP